MTGGAASEWREEALGDVLTLQRGFDLPARDRIDGPFPVVSSSGITGRHAVSKVDPPGIVIGRYGSLGLVHWVTEPYWPLNTALWVKDFKGNNSRYVSYLLRTVNTDGSTASAVPGVNRNHLHRLSVRVPSVEVQRRIAVVLDTFDKLIEINDRRIELLEESCPVTLPRVVRAVPVSRAPDPKLGQAGGRVGANRVEGTAGIRSFSGQPENPTGPIGIPQGDYGRRRRARLDRLSVRCRDPDRRKQVPAGRCSVRSHHPVFGEWKDGIGEVLGAGRNSCRID